MPELSLPCLLCDLGKFLTFSGLRFLTCKRAREQSSRLRELGSGCLFSIWERTLPRHTLHRRRAAAVVGAVGGGGQGLSRWDRAPKPEHSEQSDGAEYVTPGVPGVPEGCSRSIERDCAVTAGKSSFAHQRVLERGQSA